MSSLTYKELLGGNRPFRNLLTGQVVSELGNWFNFIAVLGLARSLTGAAPEATAVLVVLRMAPFALFAPVAGALADLWPRRALMIWTDLARAVFALGFLLVRKPEDIWIAYVSTAVSTMLAALFDGARNAALPNVAGDRGLLPGNALMHSSRFLLMSVGAALGGAASYSLGYEVAFVINALSFVYSAYTVWLIPGGAMYPADGGGREPGDEGRGLGRVWRDVGGGFRFVAGHRMVAALIGVNILWAVGGGALNLVYERFGSVVYAGRGGLEGDAGVALVYTAIGVGLFIGMLLARRVGSHVEVRGWTPAFMGWSIIAHGVLFAAAGLMPTLWLAALMMLLSRVLIGVEYAVQDTLLMRLLPDSYRGRVITTDRAAEIFVMSLTGMLAGRALGAEVLTPQGLAIASGLLSASPGVVWLLLFAWGRLSMSEVEPKEAVAARAPDETAAAAGP